MICKARFAFEKKEKTKIEEDESFLIYGFQSKEELTSIENEILNQLLNRIRSAFLDLFALKKSVMARKEVNQPLSQYLLLEYLLEESAFRFREELFQKVYDQDTNDIENALNFLREEKLLFYLFLMKKMITKELLPKGG